MNTVDKRKPLFMSHGHLNDSDKNVLNVQELLCKKEEELNKTKATLDGIREERDQLRRKVHNLNTELSKEKNSKKHVIKINGTASPSNISISRKAERIKLKKTPVKNAPQTLVEKFHGNDLDPNMLSSGITEQLLQDIRASSMVQEVLNNSTSHSLQRKFAMELERMSSCNDHLKSENNLLRLTLQESKSRTEQLQMLLSKYESNNTAQKIALFYSDLLSEAYSSMISCLEKVVLERAFLEDIFPRIKPAYKHKVQKTLKGLQYSLSDDFNASDVPNNLTEFLDQCIEGNSSNEVMTSDFLFLSNLCQEAERKKLAVKRAIVNLDSFSIGTLQSPTYSSTKSDGRVVSEFDLENAVLLHELTSVKEELVNLKCEYQKANRSHFQSNPDLSSNLMKSATSSAASYNCVWSDSAKSSNEAEADAAINKKPAFLSLADLRIGTMAESELGTELSEALKREQRLKKENDRLAFSLQQVQQNSENRHVKSSQVMSSLKESYSTLLENSKRDKLKHRARVQELEKLLAISDAKHLIQMQELRHKLLLYERERENSVLPDNETAL